MPVLLSICTANQLTGFYMRATLAFNGLNFSGNMNILRINLVTNLKKEIQDLAEIKLLF